MRFQSAPTVMGSMIGSGLYARVYEHGEGKVLKIAYNDGTSEYIEWCYLMGLEYADDSLHMRGLPRVHAFGRHDANHWWCIMDRYDHTWNGVNFGRLPTDDPAVRAQCYRIERIMGARITNDVHGGNVMWSTKRQQWIITDPCSSGTTGVSTAELRKKVPRTQTMIGRMVHLLAAYGVTRMEAARVLGEHND